MKSICLRVLLLLTFTIAFTEFLIAQNDLSSQLVRDTLLAKQIELTPKEASKFIERITGSDHILNLKNKQVKDDLLRLVLHYHEPFDSVKNKMTRFPFNTLEFNKKLLIGNVDTLPIRWLNKSTFIIDTFILERTPLFNQKTVIVQVLDASKLPVSDSVSQIVRLVEDYFLTKDTVYSTIIDTLYLKTKGSVLYRYENGIVFPTPTLRGKAARASILTNNKLRLEGEVEISRFIGDDYKRAVRDSLAVAVRSLVNYTQKRDSILVKIGDLSGKKIPFWLTSGKEPTQRVWVKNSKNDSITVWVGNPSTKTIALHLDEDLRVEVLEKRMADGLTFFSPKPERSLAKHERLKEVIIPWSYGLSSSFSLNGNYLSNWSRGGESTLSSLLDITGRADYNNVEEKTKWVNNWRLRYGFTWTDDEHGLKTNTDILEMNSQFNKVLIDKLDFSSVFYFKTQVANGYNYPKGSPKELKSRFLSPGSFTIGVGAEYKPNKKTSLNFSPLSYKNTFVIDTVNINQTLHGVDKGNRSKQEMGGQLLLRSSLTLLKSFEVTNALRLFSNFLNKPENVDVDWEMGVEKQISWYFKIRLNLHLIYDDDVRFAVTDSNGSPVLLPDGTPKKVAKTQINQFVGLTFAFKM